MISIKAKIILALLRKRHLFQGKLKKEPFGFNKESVYAFRAMCEKGAKRMKLPKGINIKKETIEGIHSEWISPEKTKQGYIILYVHGGGYVSGSCNDHRAVVAKIALGTGIKCLHYEYRLAPEHQFPAALDDSVSIYKSLIDRGNRAKYIILMGESAGGGLALALLLALKQKNLPMPKAAIAISPWTDLSCSGKSYTSKNKVSLAPLNCWNVFSYYYTGENDVKNPLISPIFGNMEGLPPLYINSAIDDELYDDGEEFYKRAQEAGVNVTFRGGYGMVHCYPLMAPMFNEATQALQEIFDFIAFHTKTSSNENECDIEM